ncbi:MAG: hypothetical protein DI626_06755, partial [Micavibrio aeruginosavorus]
MAKKTGNEQAADALDKAQTEIFPSLEIAPEEPQAVAEPANAMPSIEMAGAAPVQAPKEDETLQEDAEAFFDALSEINARIDLTSQALAKIFQPKTAGKPETPQQAAFNGASANNDLKIIAERYPHLKSQAKKATFFNETSAIIAEQKKITFAPLPAKNGQSPQT